MSAVATMRAASAAGCDLSVEGDALRCRPTPGPELLAELREHKAAIVGILRRHRCCDCAAEPGPVEIGGFGLNWWRCDACVQAHLGLRVERTPEQADTIEKAEASAAPHVKPKRRRKEATPTPWWLDAS